MEKDRTVGGAADAIERTKNASSDLADAAKSHVEERYEEAAGLARRAYGGARDAVQERAEEASDLFSELVRAGEDHVHRRPMQSLFAAAALGFMLGYLRR